MASSILTMTVDVDGFQHDDEPLSPWHLIVQKILLLAVRWRPPHFHTTCWPSNPAPPDPLYPWDDPVLPQNLSSSVMAHTILRCSPGLLRAGKPKRASDLHSPLLQRHQQVLDPGHRIKAVPLVAYSGYTPAQLKRRQYHSCALGSGASMSQPALKLTNMQYGYPEIAFVQFGTWTFILCCLF